MSAVTELTTPGSEQAFRPSGSPVRSGRVHLGRARRWFPGDGPFTVAVGFARAAWIGAPGQRPPAFRAMTYRSEVTVDDRGRLVLATIGANDDLLGQPRLRALAALPPRPLRRPSKT